MIPRFLMGQPNLIVVGSFVQDLVFRCEEFPRPSETITGRFFTGPGGKGSNQAVAASRAGGRVAFIGAVGRDGHGQAAREFLASEGVDCLLAEKPDHSTGAAGILVDSHGQNQIVVALNANEALSAADVETHAADIRNAAVLVAQCEANLEATGRALRLAKEAGVATILNPAPMRPDFDPVVLQDVTILIPNESEFAALARRLRTLNDPFTVNTLTGLSESELHGICRRLGVETVIVTLGERGCFISQPTGHLHIPALQSVDVKDTTGAGDAFVGAFAAALAEMGPENIEQAARFATAAAGISVGRFGAATAMARREEIDSFHAKRTR